jgi:hypothetical protein
MKDKFSCWRRGFDFLSKRLQLDATRLKVVSEMNKVGKASSESIKQPDNKRVALS